jgi:vacuolar-type H+-ATPase subunit F/Vma7
MSTVAYLGDVANAAGFRLAGLRTWTPGPGEELAAFRAALAACDAVLVSAAVAMRLPRDELDSALAAGRPLTVLVPDGTPCPYDPAARVSLQLGLDR